jgi:hypothetical protein
MARLPGLTVPGYPQSSRDTATNASPFCQRRRPPPAVALWAEYAEKFQVAVHAYVLRATTFTC